MPVDSGPKASSLDVGVVTETALSQVDGERGRLTVRGFDLEELAGKVGFEDVAGLLWNGSLPDANGRENFRRAIARGASLSHSADYARRMLGTAPSESADRALATYLVTIADHGMNASTFAARVVASTGSDAVSAIVAGIGALKGPLHGGAPGPVLDMLDAVGSPDRAKAWIETELAAGRRIMGMGHRIYRVRDPRAAVLERAIVELAKGPRVSSDRLS